MYTGYQTNYGYQPSYYGNAMPDNLTQLRMAQSQQMQQPLQQPMQQVVPPQQNASPIIWVSGEAGAKSYLVAPGNTVMLMDAENSTFYIKSADASGMPMPLRVFDYKERTETQMQPITAPSASENVNLDNFITRDEFERRIASIASECQCRQKAKKVKEEVVDVEPSV